MRKYMACLICVGLLLGSFQGYLALWKNDGISPEQIFPCQTHLLPPEDQKALSYGIPVDSVSELNRLLEDFLS